MLLKFFTYPTKKLFFKNPFNIMDIFAIFPYYFILFYSLRENSGLDIIAIGAEYISGIPSSVNFLRILRMFRIVRLFKLVRINQSMKVIIKAFIVSKDAVTMLLFIYALSVVFFSSLVFYAETSSCILGLHKEVNYFRIYIISLTRT